MNAEATPLTYGTNANANLAAAQSAASNLLTKENANKAMTFARENADKLSKAAKSGDLSIRALALLGGVAMCVTSVLGLMGRFVTLHWVSALIDVYLIILGLLVILLEGKKWFKVPHAVEVGVRKYALFLEFIWGRGCLYFFLGSLQMAQMGIVDIAVGAYMCFVGITYIIVGRRTAKKLSELRKNLYTEHQLKEKFNASDVENCGTINCDQFNSLLRQFGIVLSIREAESAFLQIEKSAEERINFEHFLEWWRSAEFDSEQNAQFALSV